MINKYEDVKSDLNSNCQLKMQQINEIATLTATMDKGPDNDDVNIQAVTSVGNSWIVCRSKSHVGRIYYFNTLTGEAAWNLSDVEIEKAKKRTTSILENQPETVFESCPEPKGPPTDNNNCVCKKGNLKAKARVFDKQIINNEFAKPHYAITPVINTRCVTCRPLTVGMAMPTTTSFNSNIWAFPPNHQIVIASATQSVNPNQTTFTNAYNNEEQRVSVQNTSVPLSRRFNSIHEPKYYNRFYQGTNEFSARTNGNKCNQPFYKNYSPSTSNDLRQKLTARRSFQWNKSYDDKGHNKFQNGYVQSSMQKIQIIKPTTEDLRLIDADDNWLKEHAFVEGTQLKLNIEPLKNIALSDVDLNCWFIVADSKALLDHCYLINIIVNSDEQCQLMIAEETMVELQSTSRSDDAQLMSRAHRVLQLLSQQLTSGHAVMGKESSTNSKSVDLVDFTIKLAEQNHNVVLVCQSITRKNDCNENNIPVFTIEKIKEILMNQPVSIKPKSQALPEALPEESLIKITIPNDITKKQSSERNFRFNTPNETICDLDVNTEVPIIKTNTEKIKNFDKDKNIKTQEMGVQTECNPDIKPTLNKVLHVEHNNDHGVNSNPNMPNNNLSNIEENTEAVNDIPKRREIRLKRNIYQQSANNNVNNLEKKQFKWRRRKVNSSNRTMVDSEQANNNVDDSSNDKHNQYEDITDDNLPRDSHCDETIENECNFSDTSSTCFVNRNINEKIIIEETSTSDVISNTVSNVDSGSVVSTKQNFQSHNENVNEDLSKCVMFEVENAVMEEHLETRSDEWSSRFIQIMEEVLTQILQRDTHSYHYSLPPPWTLHEATECIKRKFNDDCDIKDATNKLTNILYNISDARGNINMRLKPIDFMEMYSYGVYLVDSLQAVVNSCEDIQTASDSLAKLLADIKDPNTYSLNNDSFTDNMEDPSANDTLSSSMSCHANSIQKENDCDITSNTNQTDDNLSNNKSGEENRISTKIYNLRSKKKSLEMNVEETGVKFIRNLDVESTFFSFLKLKKNENVPILKSMSFENNLENNPHAPIENENSAEPKIVRQFSKFLEFEEKIKNKVIKELDLDNFDHAEDEPEEAFDYYDDEYNSEYDYYENEDTGYEDVYEMTSVDVNEAHTNPKTNDNHDFKWIIGKIMKEVQQALQQVQCFCKEVCEELNITKPLSPVRRLQIQERADNARTHLDKIYGSLNSILYREDTEKEDNIKTILNKAGVFFDSGMVAEYRKTVAKSLEQVDILLDSVDIVMKAVK